MRAMAVVGVMGMVPGRPRYRVVIRQCQQRRLRHARHRARALRDSHLRPPDAEPGIDNLGLGALRKNRRKGDPEWNKDRFPFHQP